ncbi:hypothetical protein BCV70DRAFT_146225, partial [Testicularia cyperi]
NATSAKDEMTRDALTPDHLESLYTDLPEDATALKAIVGTMRLELSKKDQTISKLKDEIDDVKASHSVVLQRSAEWQDELETLRVQVPQLQAELKSEKQAREAEADRVKDLRIRAEESRRAIMRLQGEQSEARAKAKADNRRSWVPGSAVTPTPSTFGARDEQEEAERKKSKRASLAFGPNSLIINPGNRSSMGHRRTASGSRSVSGNSKADGDEVEEPLSPTMANGLRGLRLSGTGGTNGLLGSSSLLVPNSAGPGDDAGSSAPNSRRSSFRSDAGRSPRLSAIDLAPPTLPDAAEISSSLGSRLAVPPPLAAGVGRMSLLASPALSQGAASSAGVGSPIIEGNEDNEDDESSSSTKALPNLPARESSIGSSISDRELKSRELEIERLTRELSETRQNMQEALEARQASEACLKALREFIASHDAEADAHGQWSNDADVAMQKASVGTGLLKGVKLPPLPTDDMDEDAEAAAHARSNTVAQKGFGAGWGMKLPTLMRKTTSSSAGAGPTSNGPTPDGGDSKSSPTTSPRASVNSTPVNRAIAGGLAGFSNLLSRAGSSTETSTSASANGTAAAPTASATASTSQANGTTPSSEDAAAGGAFKGFGWFKRASVVNGGNASPLPTPDTAGVNVTVEEKVLSPPFRSLDHDQLAIARQSVITPSATPEAEKDHSNGISHLNSFSNGGTGLGLGSGSGSGSGSGDGGAATSVIVPSRQSSSSFAPLHQLDNEKVEQTIKLSQPELSYRAQKAAEKTSHVQHPSTTAVPAFD